MSGARKSLDDLMREHDIRQIASSEFPRLLLLAHEMGRLSEALREAGIGHLLTEKAARIDRMVRYRLVEHPSNATAPWRDAIGIEQIEYNPDGSEVFAVPALVCWLTRGEGQAQLANRLVGLLNATHSAAL